jgi:hypothetical protein
MASIRQWAQLGAAQRIEEISAELAAIRKAFPAIASRRVQDGGLSNVGATPRRRRKPMTAAQKRAVGIRMKKYWAARRKADSAKL